MGTVTVREIDPHECLEIALRLMGFRSETIAGKDYLIPLDATHPEYAKCARRAAKARALADGEGRVPSSTSDRP